MTTAFKFEHNCYWKLPGQNDKGKWPI